MKKHLHLSALKIRIMVDPRVPARSLGYIEDLKDDSLPEIIEDRLAILERYTPDLISMYRASLLK